MTENTPSPLGNVISIEELKRLVRRLRLSHARVVRPARPCKPRGSGEDAFDKFVSSRVANTSPLGKHGDYSYNATYGVWVYGGGAAWVNASTFVANGTNSVIASWNGFADVTGRVPRANWSRRMRHGGVGSPSSRHRHRQRHDGGPAANDRAAGLARERADLDRPARHHRHHHPVTGFLWLVQRPVTKVLDT